MSLRFLGPTLLFVSAFSTSAVAQCPDQTFDLFEAQAYSVRQVRVQGPLLNESALRDDVVGPIIEAGSPVTAARIESARAALRQRFLHTPSLFDSALAATVIMADVASCDQATKRLDVVYKVFTTKVPLAWSRTLEAGRAETLDPAARLAIAETPVRYRLTPLLRYSAIEHLVAGGQLTFNLRRAVDRLDAAVTASDVVFNVDLDFVGAHESDAGFLRSLEWRTGYHQHDRPTDEHQMKESRFIAQAAAFSRPLGEIGAVLRGATLFEGGQTRTDFASADLPAGYLRDAGYASWKNAGGVTFRSRRHGLSGTYGLQLGFTRGHHGLDYTKTIGEVAYDGHFAAASLSHRALDVVSRLGVGRLSGDAGVPASERFFGGNVAGPFLTGEQWDAHANPVLRSFPAFSFADPGTDRAAGGDFFFSYNLTASIPVWVRPLVPQDVSTDDFIRQSIDGMLTSGESTLATSYKIADPAHQRAVVASRPLQAILESIRSRIEVLLPTLPEPQKTKARLCDEQVETLTDVVDAISTKTFVGTLLAEPVDEGDATLPSVIRACVDDLGVGDPTLADQGRALVETRTAIEREIHQIDVQSAQRLAKRELRFARDTIGTVMDEMNAIAIGPTLVFDVSRLAQRQVPRSDTIAYAVGTGVRLSVASTFHLSAGYVWNLHRLQGNRAGAAFVAVELTTLLGR